MSHAAITMEGVGKSYRLKDQRSIRHSLQDINLRVLAGESLGIFGANGSGKSTLLKLIAQITNPSAGTITITGQVAALLEVGLGFHPELTGRDNVLFNGALLGVPARVVRTHMDEIAAIADIGAYLDQPLRMYSTGMQARLGFAVACTLSAEILLLDEVLEVGDAAFRERASKLIHEMTKTQGRTAIICSHSSDLIASICDRVLWLDKGRVREIGPAAEVLENYLSYEHWGRFQAGADDAQERRA